MLDIVAKDSPKNFYRLKIYNLEESKLLPKALESFFINWGKRIPQKSLILIVSGIFSDYGLDTNEENIKMIEKYKGLGIIEEFKTEEYDVEKYLYLYN